jgi:hypothetical protein
VVPADLACTENGTTLTKQRSWGGQSNAGYAELRLTFGGGEIPGSYTISFTVGNLWDPLDANVPGANHLGCAAAFVHTTKDSSTLDILDICGDGNLAIIHILNNNDTGRVVQSMPSGRPAGQSGTFNVKVKVRPDSVAMSVNNSDFQTQEVDTADVVNSSTAYISLVMEWRNVGATAQFSNFHYSAAA